MHPNSTRTASDQIISKGLFLWAENIHFFLSLYLRSLINFVYFTVRHLDCHVHLDNEWLKAQYNMYYYTILPGFNYTVGIADSAKFWYYGPESQLYFLDSYIMRNGSGNWLADVIRKNRPKHQLSPFVSLHTDFIFYNASIPNVPPSDSHTHRHHAFEDWGVVTYSSGPLTDEKTTFATFKSSAIRGKYVHDLTLEYPEFIDKTNPGHEHPDQNSFTLTFLGDMFITDGFYGMKYSQSNNVHMFYPSEVDLNSFPHPNM